MRAIVKRKSYFSLVLAMSVLFLMVGLVYYYIYIYDRYSYKIRVGTEIHYEVEYVNQSHMDYSKVFTMKETLQSAGAGVNAYDTETFIQGEFILSPVANEGDAMMTAVLMQKPKVNLYVNKKTDQDINTAIERALSSLLFVKLDHKGKIGTIWFPNSLKETRLNSIIRTIISLLQIELGSRQEVANGHWTTLESDPNGTYESEYILGHINDNGDLIIRKKKKNYIKNENEDHVPSIISPDIEPDCIIEAEFNLKEGRLIQLSWTENQKLSMAGNVVGYNNTKFILKHIRSVSPIREQYAQIKKIYKNMDQDYFPGSIFIEPDIDAIRTAIYTKNVQGLTWEDLITRFNNVRITHKINKDQKTSDLLTLLQSYINVHPDDAMRIAAYCETAPRESFEMEMIPRALTAAGTREAQLALIHIIRKRSSDDDLCRLLLPSLAIPAKPISESVDILKTFTSHQNKEISENACLVLGVIAGKMEAFDKNISNELTEYLTNKLSNAVSEDETALYLSVLGNIRTEKAFSHIKPYLKNEAVEIRACAVSALKNVKSNESKDEIINILLNEKNDIVRAKAIEALIARKPSGDIFEIFKTFSYDPSDRVRLKSMEGLWQIRRKFPDSIYIIEDVAGSDPSKDIRSAAKTLLNGK